MHMKTIIRNGIKSNLRAKGRTTLFFLLITLFTAIMMLSLGVRLYCDNVLEQCGTRYRSIALLEYMGGDYPDEDVADARAREAASALDVSRMQAVNGVKSYIPAQKALLYADGYVRSGSKSDYAKHGVICVSGISHPYYRTYLVEVDPEEIEGEFDPDDDSFSFGMGSLYREETDYSRPFYYSARIASVYYGMEQKENVLINILPGETGWTPEFGETYLLNGIFHSKNTVDGMLNSLTAFELLPFEDSDEQPFIRCTDGMELPEAFEKAVEKYTYANSYIYADYFTDLEDIYEFHQGLVYIENGRAPQAGEEGACVISADLAGKLGVTAGGRISVTVLSSDEKSRYSLTPSQTADTLTVTGITNATNDYQSHIWIMGQGPSQPLFGYQLGTLTLENAAAIQAVEEIQEFVPEGVRVLLYDQGYGDTVKPFNSMRSTATNVLMICALGMAAVLILFAFLFVSRQNYTVKIMISLGTDRSRVAAWFVAGTLVISLGAALTGGLLGQLGLPVLFEKIEASIADEVQISTLYSETVLGITKDAAYSTDFAPGAVWLAAAAVVLASVVLTLAFLPSAFRDGSLKRGKTRVRVPHGRTVTAGRGALRFASLSILRGGLRSLVVPAVSLVLTLVMIVLGGIYSGWHRQLAAAHEETVIDGIAVSINGRYYSDLVIPIENVRKLISIENVDRVWLSAPGMPYWSPAEMPSFGDGGFSRESRMDWIKTQPQVVPANNLRGAKEFYYSEPVVKWKDGWDESFLAGEYETIYDHLQNMTAKPSAVSEGGSFPTYTIPGVAGDRYMQERGLEIGDSFSVFVLEDRMLYEAEIPIEIEIVGSYRQIGEKAQIYTPLSMTVIPDAVYTQDPEAHRPQTRYEYYGYTPEETLEYFYYFKTVFSTCRFTLSSAKDLDDAREALYDMGFSKVGKTRSVRTSIVLRDAAYLKLTETLQRYIYTGRIIMTMIFAVIAVTGFIISWLMINTRKREFALMRGLGTGRGRIYLSFFLEQALLALAGCGIGCLSMLLISGSRLQWMIVAGYLVFYLLGCSISIILIGRSHLMELLTNRE